MKNARYEMTHRGAAGLTPMLLLSVDMCPAGWRVLHTSRHGGYSYESAELVDEALGMYRDDDQPVSEHNAQMLAELARLVWSELVPCNVQVATSNVVHGKRQGVYVGPDKVCSWRAQPKSTFRAPPIGRWSGVAIRYWGDTPLLIVEIADTGLRRFTTGVE